MLKFFPDLLKQANDDVESLDKLMKDYAFSIVMTYAFDPDKKMVLPEGVPPYRKDPAPIGMSPTTLRYEAKRLYVFARADLSKLKRETLFVQLLESLHPLEAEILLAIKDQSLDRLYPNLNRTLMSKFGLCPVPEKEESQVLPKSKEIVQEAISDETTESVEQKPRGRGRPKKAP